MIEVSWRHNDLAGYTEIRIINTKAQPGGLFVVGSIYDSEMVNALFPDQVVRDCFEAMVKRWNEMSDTYDRIRAVPPTHRHGLWSIEPLNTRESEQKAIEGGTDAPRDSE